MEFIGRNFFGGGMSSSIHVEMTWVFSLLPTSRAWKSVTVCPSQHGKMLWFHMMKCQKLHHNLPRIFNPTKKDQEMSLMYTTTFTQRLTHLNVMEVLMSCPWYCEAFEKGLQRASPSRARDHFVSSAIGHVHPPISFFSFLILENDHSFVTYYLIGSFINSCLQHQPTISNHIFCGISSFFHIFPPTPQVIIKVPMEEAGFWGTATVSFRPTSWPLTSAPWKVGVVHNPTNYTRED